QLLQAGSVDAATLQDWGVTEAAALAQRLQEFDPATLGTAERLNVPDFHYQRWLLQYGEGGAAALARALNQPARVDLRVNTLKATRDSARARLAEEGLRAEPTARSPLGLRLPGRAPLQNLALFREGWIEPQDEGSQLIALLLAVQPGETVVDFCAGAGGKTLALAAQLRDRGRLLACDNSAARLQRLQPRLQRAGVGCVQALPLRDEHDPLLDAHAGRCDAVLVDAPCSATGTWRRNPELRLREPGLDTLQQQQRSILQAAARLLRPGGRLVYATCSLMAEENEQVVESFLTAHPQFQLQDAGTLLQAQGADYEGAVLRLLPHVDGTDGFYAVAMRRAE
ncbi:MAG TPA: RsmB/NOP family class I SAM-dependent RNA methyltransferase, partial [Solimonas sp.]|nr:RsmB/NOP family class I SAM-dependent RNA methyltransferase [Solimonas sp.]